MIAGRDLTSLALAALMATLIPGVVAAVYVVLWPVEQPITYLPMSDTDRRLGYASPQVARPGQRVALCRHVSSRIGVRAKFDIDLVRVLPDGSVQRENTGGRFERITVRARDAGLPDRTPAGTPVTFRTCRAVVIQRDTEPGEWMITSTGYHDPCRLGVCGVREVQWDVPMVPLRVEP